VDEKLAKKIKELEKLGYKVKKEVKTVKKTFEVPELLLAEFVSITKARKLKMKDAISEAIELFVSKNKG
jgi:hypothetical protein